MLTEEGRGGVRWPWGRHAFCLIVHGVFWQETGSQWTWQSRAHSLGKELIIHHGLDVYQKSEPAFW